MRVVLCVRPDDDAPGFIPTAIADQHRVAVLSNDEAKRRLEDGEMLSPWQLQTFVVDQCLHRTALHHAEIAPLCERLRNRGGDGCIVAMGAAAEPVLGEAGILGGVLCEMLAARSSEEELVVSALRVDSKPLSTSKARRAQLDRALALHPLFACAWMWLRMHS